MKRKIVGLLSVAIASGAVLTACGTSETNETTAETTTSAAETTTANTTSAETTTAKETSAATKKYTDESEYYDIEVLKTYSGYADEEGLLIFKGDKGTYTYAIMDEVSSHVVEADTDQEVAKFTNPSDYQKAGKNDEYTYVSGKTEDGKNCVVAYKEIGQGKDLSCYIMLYYETSDEITATDVENLLGDEYIAFYEK